MRKGGQPGTTLYKFCRREEQRHRPEDKEGHEVKGGLLCLVWDPTARPHTSVRDLMDRETQTAQRWRAETENRCRNVTGRSETTPSSHAGRSKGRGEPWPHVAHGDRGLLVRDATGEHTGKAHLICSEDHYSEDHCRSFTWSTVKAHWS